MNGNTQTYPLGYGHAEGVEEITHHAVVWEDPQAPNPTITLRASEDPDHPGSYVTTFFSSLEAYTLPEGVTAYTATANGNSAHLNKLADPGQTLHKGAAVLLYMSGAEGGKTIDFTMPVTTELGTDVPAGNLFSGVNLRTATTSDSTPYYIFTYGHNGLGFYYKKDSNPLLANKAFIHQAGISSVSAFSLIFPDEEQTTGIDQSLLDEIAVPEGDIYSVSGVQLRKPRQGVNIICGKKVFIK